MSTSDVSNIPCNAYYDGPYPNHRLDSNDSSHHVSATPNQTFIERHKKKIILGAVVGSVGAGAVLIPGVVEMAGAGVFIAIMGVMLVGALVAFAGLVYERPKSAISGALVGGCGTAIALFMPGLSGVIGLAALVGSSSVGGGLGSAIAIFIGAVWSGIIFILIADCCMPKFTQSALYSYDKSDTARQTDNLAPSHENDTRNQCDMGLNLIRATSDSPPITPLIMPTPHDKNDQEKDGTMHEYNTDTTENLSTIMTTKIMPTVTNQMSYTDDSDSIHDEALSNHSVTSLGYEYHNRRRDTLDMTEQQDEETTLDDSSVSYLMYDTENGEFQ